MQVRISLATIWDLFEKYQTDTELVEINEGKTTLISHVLEHR